MITMEMVDMPPDKIMRAVLCLNSGAEAALERSKGIKAQLEPYQAAALYMLARQYNQAGACILEIGTLVGFSASLMAQAAPSARIVTLNPAEHEIPDAVANLGGYQNISIIVAASWDYLESYDGPELSMVFVDGDHKRVARDLPWWDWVAEDGLMLFHDYSREQCPPVYEAVNAMGEALGREPDVLLVDDGGVGMAGFYKR